MKNESERGAFGLRAWVGLILGLSFLGYTLVAPAPSDLSLDGWRVVGVIGLMALFWVSECIPVSATALLPLVLFPILAGQPISAMSSPYANPLIFLFLGGFLLASAIQSTGLHRRVALRLLWYFGAGRKGVLLGLLLSSALVSMWVSNTATALMMLPICISVLTVFPSKTREQIRFRGAAFLAVAYGCSIGGVATLIGTPPNALMAAYVEQNYGYSIGFLEWMQWGLPLSLFGLGLAFLLLLREAGRSSDAETQSIRERITGERNEIGPVSTSEIRVGIVFMVVAVTWMARPSLQALFPLLSDAGVAIGGAVLLFLVPRGGGEKGFLLGSDSFGKVPWGILILFGGGLSLAAAMRATGVGDWMAGRMGGLEGLPPLLMLGLFAAVILILTELTSNTATTATFLPVAAAVAVAIGFSESAFLVATALAASCAFMMPVGTPPNAVVYGSGEIPLIRMIRVGVWLNLLFLALIIGGLALFSGLLPDLGLK